MLLTNIPPDRGAPGTGTPPVQPTKPNGDWRGPITALRSCPPTHACGAYPLARFADRKSTKQRPDLFRGPVEVQSRLVVHGPARCAAAWRSSLSPGCSSRLLLI